MPVGAPPTIVIIAMVLTAVQGVDHTVLPGVGHTADREDITILDLDIDITSVCWNEGGRSHIFTCQWLLKEMGSHTKTSSCHGRGKRRKD